MNGRGTYGDEFADAFDRERKQGKLKNAMAENKGRVDAALRKYMNEVSGFKNEFERRVNEKFVDANINFGANSFDTVKYRHGMDIIQQMLQEYRENPRTWADKQNQMHAAASAATSRSSESDTSGFVAFLGPGQLLGDLPLKVATGRFVFWLVFADL